MQISIKTMNVTDVVFVKDTYKLVVDGGESIYLSPETAMRISEEVRFQNLREYVSNIYFDEFSQLDPGCIINSRAYENALSRITTDIINYMDKCGFTESDAKDEVIKKYLQKNYGSLDIIEVENPEMIKSAFMERYGLEMPYEVAEALLTYITKTEYLGVRGMETFVGTLAYVSSDDKAIIWRSYGLLDILKEYHKTISSFDEPIGVEAEIINVARCAQVKRLIDCIELI